MGSSINVNLDNLNNGSKIFGYCESTNSTIRADANAFYGALANSRICDRNMVYSSTYLSISQDLTKIRQDINNLESIYSDVLGILKDGLNELSDTKISEIDSNFKLYFSDIESLGFKETPAPVETPKPAASPTSYTPHTPTYTPTPVAYVAPAVVDTVVTGGVKDNVIGPDNTPEYNEVVTTPDTGEDGFVGGTYKGVKMQYSKRYNVSSQPLTSRLGVVYFEGYKETYYSQRVLPGGGLKIPGRHVAEDGTVRDKDGFICVAANHLAKGSMIMTSLGPGKVYDCGDMVGNWIDIYVDW